MKIETKYDVGHTYWVPRVKKIFVRKETLCHEGEEWHRDVFETKAFAKQKRIVTVEIKINKDSSYVIMYGVEDVEDETLDLLQWYPEANMTEHTEESALVFAEGFLSDNPDKLYYGN